MENKNKKLLWTNEEIQTKINQTTNQINEYYKDKEAPIILGLLKGCLVIYGKLITKFNFELETEFSRAIVNVEEGKKESVWLSYSFNNSIEGRNVLIVEDIADSGITLSDLIKDLKIKGAADIKTLAFIDKIKNRKTEFKVDWPILSTTEQGWITGWGIDLSKKERSLPDIYLVEK